MEELYNSDVEEIKTEIKSIDELKNEEFLNTKKELLQCYLICLSLYKENKNEDILKKLIKITELLTKCKEMENKIDDLNKVKDEEETNKRILNDLNKKRYKKSKGNNPRKKFKDRNDKMTEKCTKKYDGKI